MYKIMKNFTYTLRVNLFSRDLQLLKTSRGYLLYRVSSKTANKYEVTYINLFTSISKYGCRCADSQETHASLATICEKSYTGYYYNSTLASAPDARSQTDKYKNVVFTKGFLYYLTNRV